MRAPQTDESPHRGPNWRSPQTESHSSTHRSETADQRRRHSQTMGGKGVSCRRGMAGHGDAGDAGRRPSEALGGERGQRGGRSVLRPQRRGSGHSHATVLTTWSRRRDKGGRGIPRDARKSLVLICPCGRSSIIRIYVSNHLYM